MCQPVIIDGYIGDDVDQLILALKLCCSSHPLLVSLCSRLACPGVRMFEMVYIKLAWSATGDAWFRKGHITYLGFYQKEEKSEIIECCRLGHHVEVVEREKYELLRGYEIILVFKNLPIVFSWSLVHLGGSFCIKLSFLENYTRVGSSPFDTLLIYRS